MDSIEFRLKSEEFDVGNGLTVTPYVNGTSLIELARRAEGDPATEHGEPDLAGSYSGLAFGHQEPWSHWYLDDDPQRWFDDGDSCLLGCTCGAEEVDPLPGGQVLGDRGRADPLSMELRLCVGHAGEGADPVQDFAKVATTTGEDAVGESLERGSLLHREKGAGAATQEEHAAVHAKSRAERSCGDTPVELEGEPR